MLDTLRRIVQEVNTAQNLEQSLNIIVQEVAKAINTECCSIYLTEPEGYVLAASVGFNEAASKARVIIPPEEGLVGLVGKREEPINLDNAASHPKYRYFPETGEERYLAFLGVPIIHQRNLLGVLVVQQRDARKFDDGEEAFLVTVSAQLAGVIAHAKVTGKVPAFGQEQSDRDDATVTGIPSSSGVAIGCAVIIYPPADLDAVPDKRIDSVEAEIERFQKALLSAKQDVQAMSAQLASKLPPEELALFDVYARILDSENLGKEIEEQIVEGLWAPAALKRVIKKHIQLFESMEDDYLKERATDFRDLGRRVLRHLQYGKRASVDYPSDTILVSDELTASALAEVPPGRLSGIISVKGSANSHVAILARAMDIPAVMGAESLPVERLEGSELIVDGYTGEIFVSPSAALKEEFRRLEAEERELYTGLDEMRQLRSETPDGRRIPLCVNTGLVADIRPSLEAGAEGVGLYRTEVPFMIRDRFPAEDEQCAIYKQLLQAFTPKPVTIRTLDVGGDKSLPYFPIVEENPFLGWRGIRITLDHPEIFLVQMRAMLRASVGLENLRILLPMISGVHELDDALHLIHQAYGELKEDGLNIQMPPIGIMVEVPSVVYQAQILAKKVDFLSVGSNDLTQYLLAVDRNNSRVASLYDALHPSVLRALMSIVEGAHAENKIVSICGEMAAEPIAVILLLAMDFDMLSMNSTSLPRVKWVIRNFTIAKAKKILEEVLQMDNPREIRQHLESAIEGAGLGGLIRAGK